VTDFDLVAAALRKDAADITIYAQVLLSTLGDVLPPGCVTVTRERGLADRLRGREGQVREVAVRLGDRVLTLSSDRGRPVAEVRHEVRGVTLSREPVGLDVWIDTLAGDLVERAGADARAAEALRRLVAGS
jgi:hypothetical protein